MDVVAEYAAAYGGAPRPDQPWHEVLALVVRAPRFEQRRVLHSASGAALAQGPDMSGQKEMVLGAIERNAYPFEGPRGA